jgi:hypothetical protein
VAESARRIRGGVNGPLERATTARSAEKSLFPNGPCSSSRRRGGFCARKLARFFRNLITCQQGELDLPYHHRHIAASLDITERSAFGIITGLVKAGYVVKEKDGRSNRYHIQAHLPLPEPAKPPVRWRAATGVGPRSATADGGGRDVTDVWVANDEGTEIVRARDIAVANLDYNGNVKVRLAGADGAVVTLVAHRAHHEEHRPGDLHRQLLRVIAELSDAAGAFLVRAVHDETRGWQWVTEPL